MRRHHRGSLRLVLLVLTLIPTLVACAPAPPPAPTSPAATPPPTRGPLPAAAPTAVASPVAQAAPTAGPKRGGALTEAASSDAVSFHPYTTSDGPSRSYQSMIYGGDLWTYDPHTLVPRPEAATNWTISEDKLTYTFKLRPDLKWSDGAAMTSADYKFAFEQAIKPENKYPYVSNLELIASYETPDPQTIIVRMEEAIAVGFEAANAITPLPKHVWEKLDWSDPARNPQIMAPTIASGPFKLKEWRKDDHVIFEANESYFKGRPLLDSYTIRIVPSLEIAVQMLKSGEVDMVEITSDLYPDVKTFPNVEMYEYWPAAASYLYVGFNLRRPHLQDANIRRALSHAVDRKAIAENIQNNLAQPTYSIFTPSSWVYNPNVPKYEFDKARAGQMLDDAGWRTGPDGIRQKDGKPLKLRILYGPVTQKQTERIATVVQQMLQDVGADTEIQGLEWGAYLSALKKEPYDWDVNLGGWSGTIEPHWTNQIWREDTIPELNHVGYVNKQVEDLFEQGVKEFDLEKRKQIYQQIQQTVSEDAPYIFLTYRMGFQPVNKRIGGIETTPLGIGHNVEKWYVK
jgi:peptide/nickel transport system substrate-binding protein